MLNCQVENAKRKMPPVVRITLDSCVKKFPLKNTTHFRLDSLFLQTASTDCFYRLLLQTASTDCWCCTYDLVCKDASGNGCQLVDGYVDIGAGGAQAFSLGAHTDVQVLPEVELQHSLEACRDVPCIAQRREPEKNTDHSDVIGSDLLTPGLQSRPAERVLESVRILALTLHSLEL